MRQTVPLVALFLVTTSAHAESACPLNYINCNTHQFTSAAPTYSQSCPAEFQQYGSSSVSYDLTTGAFDASSSGREFGSGAGMTAFDTYQLAGSTSHCGFTFQAHLRVTGRFTRVRSGAEGDFEARLRDSSSGHEANFTQVSHFTTSVDTVLTIDLAECSTPFDLLLELNTSALWGDETAHAQLIFTGLPPGVSVTSCQGFHGEEPIATLPVSWGSVRARYR